MLLLLSIMLLQIPLVDGTESLIQCRIEAGKGPFILGNSGVVRVPLTGGYTNKSDLALPVGVAWKLLTGPANVRFDNPRILTPVVTVTKPGRYVFWLVVSNNKHTGLCSAGIDVLGKVV